MGTVVVVDDSAVDRRVAQKALEAAGMTVLPAADGFKALQLIHQREPDLVVSDLQMPEMDGVQLVEAIRSRHPQTPVVLMTAYGSEEIAVQALRAGAAGYVPKRNLFGNLAETVGEILAMARSARSRSRLLEHQTQSHSHFDLVNDPALIGPLVEHFEETLTAMNLCDETGAIRVGIALKHALSNALLHGNLELSAEELHERTVQDDRGASYRQLIDSRRQQSPYRDRRIHVDATISKSEAMYVIRDEGPGFDHSRLPGITDPENLGEGVGRGLVLIRSFFDQVAFNEAGNEITLRKEPERPVRVTHEPGLVHE